VPGGRLEETVAQIDECRLTATAWSDDGDELAIVNFEVYLVESQEPAARPRLIILMPQSYCL
jgi:hypothetical protein